MPHFVIIDDDVRDRNYIVQSLSLGYRSVGRNITTFSTAGDFLRDFMLLGTVDVIITEQLLPLLKVGPDAEQRLQRLTAVFPEVAVNFDCHHAGERLIRWLRHNKDNFPVIIYTDSDERLIEPDVLQDRNVKYCRRESKNSPPAQLSHI